MEIFPVYDSSSIDLQLRSLNVKHIQYQYIDNTSNLRSKKSIYMFVFTLSATPQHNILFI